ncbi:hypothetical protein SteCoe_20494 [Stentor coeruleus]|uniref:Uncharacterized protein n=1 Tax=Stentor coeruleus TaxID=5963 RepID=A0A1R2BSC7_9CILI|nr:hypothetical protein SteCoe_20494 [Stentor coeruleus]
MEGRNNLLPPKLRVEKSLDASKILKKKKVASIGAFLTPKCKKLEVSEGEYNRINCSPLQTECYWSGDESKGSPLGSNLDIELKSTVFAKNVQKSFLNCIRKKEKCISEINLPKKASNKQKTKTTKLNEKHPSSPDLFATMSKLPKTVKSILKSPINTSKEDNKKFGKSLSPPSQPSPLKNPKKIPTEIFTKDHKKTSKVFKKCKTKLSIISQQKSKFFNENPKKKTKIVNFTNTIVEENEYILKRCKNLRRCSLGYRNDEESLENENEEDKNAWIQIENIRNDGKTSEFVKNFVMKIQKNSICNMVKTPEKAEQNDGTLECVEKAVSKKNNVIIPKLRLNLDNTFDDYCENVNDDAFILNTSETLNF